MNTELDFDKVERTSTVYDQDSSAIVSEERMESTNPTAEGGGEEQVITNYDTGRTVENLISSPGSISGLTVSVLIDSKDSTWVDEDGDIQAAKVLWSDTEMADIRRICENAVGYDPTRDRLEIVNLPFGTREFEDEAAERLTMRATFVESIQAVSTGIAILVAIGVFYIILRQITRSLDPSKVTLQIDAILEKEKKEIIEELEEPGETDKSTLIRKIITKASQDPETTAKTIRTIYRSEG